MIKKYTLSILSLLFVVAGFAQQNSFRVINILSPSARVIYQTVDSADFIIEIRNDGPNALIAGDEFRVNYSLGDGGPNSSDSTILVQVGGTQSMAGGEFRTYTLEKNVKFSGNTIFSACADVLGSVIYPTNTEKNSSDCERFAVGIEKQVLKIENVSYANQQINVSLNQDSDIKLEVFSITGRRIFEKSLKRTSSVIIPLSIAVKGFYFLKVSNESGSNATSKFVVH